MMDNVLYIIGNGFDLHHGIMSSYKSLSIWLRKHDRNLFYLLSGICKADFLWSDFERALAYIDRSYFAGAEILLPDKVDDDTSAADLIMAGDTARCEGENVWSSIVEGFRKWVDSIRASKTYDTRKIMLDSCARFINFNYTTFLESEYGIDEKQILYIHGRRASRKNPPVIGHSGEDTFNKWYRRNRHYHRYYNVKKDGLLPEIQMLTEGIEEYYSLSEKPVREILEQNDAFFGDLYDIKHVYVLGHSLADVDLPYFQRIIEANDNSKDINWHFSCFGEKDKKRISLVAERMGIDAQQVSTFEMNDLLLPHNRL